MAVDTTASPTVTGVVALPVVAWQFSSGQTRSTRTKKAMWIASASRLATFVVVTKKALT